MKPVSFLRNTWRKKDSKSLQPPVSTTPEEALPEIPSSPRANLALPDDAYSHPVQCKTNSPPIPTDRASDAILPSHDRLEYVMGEEKQFSSYHKKAGAPYIHLRLVGSHGAIFNSSHGPPHNPSHGPPSLNQRRPDPSHKNYPYRPTTAPSRPPRPPSLDLYTHPDHQLTAMPRSPSRVRFAPESQVRPPHPDSPARSSFRRVGQMNGSEHDTNNIDLISSDKPGPCHNTEESIRHETSLETDKDKTSSGTADTPKHSTSKSSHAGEYLRPVLVANTRPNASNSDPIMESSRTAHAVLDLSDSPTHHTLYRSTGSTPHLPYIGDKPCRPASESSKSNIPSDSPLALFPSPPLFIRKRPKPLVLLPTPTLARLPPSPAFPSSPSFSSTDSTPLTTPATPHSPLAQKGHSVQSLRLQKHHSPKTSPGRSLHPISPPRYSPPNSPLPTPPTSPKINYLSPPNVRQLRAAQSTSDFRSGISQSTSTHRPTLSAPSSETFPPNDIVRKRTQSRPEKLTMTFDTREVPPVPVPAMNSQIQWGYAV